jgi:tetratricopeptide (TPR) repeat protein
VEIPNLTETQAYADLFRQSLLEDIAYWHKYLQDEASHNSALRGKRAQIIKSIWFALDVDTAWPPASTLIETFSPSMERWGYWETWGQVLDKAIAMARRVNDFMKAADLAVTLALMGQRQSRFREAVSHYRRAIRLARQAGNQVALARAYTNLGYLYTEQGYWWRAEILCGQALDIFAAIQHESGRAHTENHLGVLHMRQARWAGAQHHLERACTIWQAMGDEHGLMRGYINFSALSLRMEQPNQALTYLEKALQIAQVTGDEASMGRIYLNMGLAHRVGGDLAQAETYAKQAEAIFRRVSDWAELARVQDNLGVVYCHQGRWSAAIAHMEEALSVWRRLKNRTGEIEVLLDLVACELARGDQHQALRRLKEVEKLIGPGELQDHHLQAQVAQYRRSLTGQATR